MNWSELSRRKTAHDGGTATLASYSTNMAVEVVANH